MTRITESGEIPKVTIRLNIILRVSRLRFLNAHASIRVKRLAQVREKALISLHTEQSRRSPIALLNKFAPRRPGRAHPFPGGVACLPSTLSGRAQMSPRHAT